MVLHNLPPLPPPLHLQADDILNDLKSDIEAMTGSHANITVTKLANELELQHTADMDVHAEGGIDNLALVAIKEVAVSTSDLPVQSRHGRLFQIKLTAGNDSDFWVKFVANDGPVVRVITKKLLTLQFLRVLTTRQCHTSWSTLH